MPISRRQRGVVLTDRGKARLEAAIATAQDQEKYGTRFTQAELEERTQLSIKTIKKILEQASPTDESSVRSLFKAFGLELEPADYGQSEPVPAGPTSLASPPNRFNGQHRLGRKARYGPILWPHRGISHPQPVGCGRPLPIGDDAGHGRHW